MNRLFIILSLFCCYCESYSQLISIPSQQKAKDMVYDAITDKIYITIPTTDVTNGNSIGIVNPYTNVLESTLFVGDDPTEMAISDNGQYIYVAFDGVPKIKRYTLNPLAFDIEFGLGVDPPPSNHGSFYARDIVVMPGQANTIAVSRKVIDNVSPDHAGIGIYDDGIMRPTDYFTAFTLKITKIKFKDANTLIGHSGTGIPSHTALFNINTNGITIAADYTDMPNPHPYGATSDFVCRQDKLYFMNGKTVNLSTSVALGTQFTSTVFQGGGVMYDEYNSLVCFADALGIFTFYQNGYWDGNFKRYNPITYQLYDSLRITTGGEVDKMVSCGNNCYALLTEVPRLVIVRNQDPLSNNHLAVDSSINLYPNPSHEVVYIEKSNNLILKNVALYDALGKMILTDLDTDRFDLTAIQSGIYFCKMITRNGEVITKKIIKN